MSPTLAKAAGAFAVALSGVAVIAGQTATPVFTVAQASAGREPQLHAPAMLAGELRARRARLHMQLEDHSAAAARRKWLRGMSST